MSVSIKAKLEMKGLNDLKKRLKKLDRKELEWGFLEGDHSNADMSYAALANILEYGARSDESGWEIPPRPAFGTLVNELEANHTIYEKTIEPHFRDFVEGTVTTPHRILEESGEHMTERLQDTMHDWVYDGTMNNDNAPSTIRQKGENRPFVDTGELIDNVTYETK